MDLMKNTLIKSQMKDLRIYFVVKSDKTSRKTLEK